MKAGVIAPLYLSISWVLTVSYQLLTDTAVRSLSAQIGLVWPAAALWINSNIQTIVFIYAFTWIFVLSSVIPSAIVGKERGVITQYIVVLTLSLIALLMPDILFAFLGIQVEQVLSTVVILQNPFVAAFYLSIPYLFMLGMDWRGRTLKKRKALEATKTAEINRTGPLTVSEENSEASTE
jgi:hypothetical protein